MMYLSHLLIDVGDNPDRPRPGRLWLRNVYHVHQRLSMAFPMKSQREKDPHFLLPFDPSGFDRPRFLFRIDNHIDHDCQRSVILVQSELEPDWDYAFHNAKMFLAAPPEKRELESYFQNGDCFHFRVRMNLSKKSRNEKSRDGVIELRKPREGIDSKGRPKDQGMRVALTWKGVEGETPDAVIRNWFAAKGNQYGFDLIAFDLVHLGWARGWRPKKRDDPTKHSLRFRSALLEGSLRVTQAEDFAEKAVLGGIGSAKAFGFGLLSLAPLARSPDAP